MIEIIGWVATVFVILSFTQNNLIRLRILSLIGSILWAIYGILIESSSVIFLNFVIIFIQIYWIYKNFKK